MAYEPDEADAIISVAALKYFSQKILIFSIDETVEIFIMRPIPNLRSQKFHQFL